MTHWQDRMADMDCAPSVTTLWERRRTARKPYTCYIRSDPIPAGEKYTSIGLISDGEFQYLACPRFAEQDRREAREQFAKDDKWFNEGIR